MKIEVIGAEFNNKGAELMLVAVCQQLVQHLHISPLMAPSLFASFEQRSALQMRQVLRLQVGKYDFTSLLGLMPNFLKKRLAYFGIVIEQDIDVVLDASGFAYGDHWSLQRLKQAAAIARRVQKRGGKYILLPQALGPFDKADYATLASSLFEHSEIIFARDNTSLDVVKRLAPNANVFLAPDFTALTQPSIKQSSSNQCAKSLCVIPNVNMQKVVSASEYLVFLQRVSAFFFAQGFSIQILNHEGKADQAVCIELEKSLKEELSIPASIITPNNALEVKAVIQHADWVMSSRFHGCVSGLSAGKPTLATSWSHKYEALYEDYQLPHYVISVTDNEPVKSIETQLKELLSQRKKDELIQQAALSSCLLKIEEMWTLLFECLKR